MRLEEAGVSKNVLEIAISQFCLEVIANHGYAAPRLLNYILKHDYLKLLIFCILGYAIRIH